MNREALLNRVEQADAPWDVIVIGGGATGLGTVVDAAGRGYRALLLEQHDFAKGTSSRSTKLVHGGVRYLKQGNVSLVLEALRERGRLLRNAPHLVRNLPFVVPVYDWWEGPFYGVGLRLYDKLAGKLGFGDSRNLSITETRERIPTIEPDGLRGGVIYYDGQFDDARLALTLARTAVDLGGTVLNYARVSAITKSKNIVNGVVFVDEETGKEHSVHGRVVINATGVFSDSVRRMDDPDAAPIVRASQGVHIVLDRSFLPGETAIMVPETDDGRVLFAIPWRNRVVIGTTDTPVDQPSLEPMAFDHELEFLLTHAVRYLTKDPSESDVLSAFAGLRPLVSSGDEADTASISREHTIHVSRCGLLTITGGKWTTYRQMAQDTIDQAIEIGQLAERPCPTEDLRLHGWHARASDFGDLGMYGADAPAVRDLIRSDADMGILLHPKLRVRAGEVIWAVRNEMARTVEDVLSRRSRSILLDARASVEAAPRAARLMAAELNRDASWERGQVDEYTKLARRYMIGES